MGGARGGGIGLDRRAARCRFVRPRGRTSDRRSGRVTDAQAGTCHPWSPGPHHGRLGRGWPVRDPARTPRWCGSHGAGQRGFGASAGLRELGADDVVADIAQLRGRFDLILESVGGATLGRLVTIVDPDGTLVMFGNSSMSRRRSMSGTSSTMASSAFRDSNCSSERIRSVATLSTSRRWWARASSIRNSQGHCRGSRSRGPCSGHRTATSPARSPSRLADGSPAAARRSRGSGDSPGNSARYASAYVGSGYRSGTACPCASSTMRAPRSAASETVSSRTSSSAVLGPGIGRAASRP